MHYDDVFAVLGLESAAVAGHSFGAMAAAELAAWYPSRVSRLALVSPIGLWSDDRPVTDVFATPARELDRLLFAEPGGPPATAFAAGVLDGSDTEKRVALSQALTTVARFLFPIPDRGLARRLRRITAPTLVVAGAADTFVPPGYAVDFAAGIRGATRELIEGAGHMVPLEAPDRTVELLSSFLAAVAA
jgi:pimeloyl-ACP methyl ester carboxylesterase